MDLLCAEAEKERVRRLEGEHCDDDTALPPLATATVETAEEADQADQKQQQQSMGDGEWECLDLRCAISFQPLNDPAKGSNCTHHACCNYKALRDYALASKRCPLENCRAQLRCTREVARDAKLKALLIHAPAGATAVWFRAEQLRTWQSHPASDLEEASALAALAGVPPVAGVSASTPQLGKTPPPPPVASHASEHGPRGAKRSLAESSSCVAGGLDMRQKSLRMATSAAEPKRSSLSWQNVIVLSQTKNAPAGTSGVAPSPPRPSQKQPLKWR